MNRLYGKKSSQSRSDGSRQSSSRSASWQKATPVYKQSTINYLPLCGSACDASLNTLRSLLRLSSEFRQATSNVRRIQRGSPGAGALGGTVWSFQPRFTAIAVECQKIFIVHSRFPGIDLLRTRLNELQQTLSEPFNDGGNECGYSERVRFLEKLNYTNGTLRGTVEMIIEHHEYWKNQLAGQEHQPLAQRLNFNVTETTTAISPFAGFFVLCLLYTSDAADE